MFEFNFDSSKIKEEVTQSNGGYSVLDTGNYTFSISSIGELRYTQNNDAYRVITFKEVKSGVTFNEFLTLSVNDEKNKWRIENKTKPIIYRLMQCANLDCNDWEDALIGKRFNVSVEKVTQKRRSKEVDAFGVPKQIEVEANQLARGRYADIITPATQVESNDTGAAFMEDINNFFNK